MKETAGNREKILARALELFSARGYEGASVNEVALLAGITKPTLYYYFNSKEGLYDSLMRENYERLNTALAVAVVYNPNPSEYFADVYPVLLEVSLTYYRFASANEDFYRMALADLFQPRSSQIHVIAAKYHFRQYELLEEMFRRMSAVHKNMARKEKMLAWTYAGMVNSFISLAYNAGTPLEELMENAEAPVRQFMHGIYS